MLGAFTTGGLSQYDLPRLLGALAAACSNMTEALRGQETLPQDPALYAAVQAEYAKVREALDQLDKE